ncbi:MAG: YesL family protein [Clostridiales bacterium]|nr:YesL family protein [Clostridiales bacterium]
MNEIFNTNNPVMRFMTNMFNIFWVNALFLVTSLPIITIGASLCGLYKVCIAIVSGDDPEVTKMYFKEFKSSFGKATILWIIILALGSFFGFELYAIYFRPDLISSNMSFLQYPIWLGVLILVQVFIYGFALLATFENTLKNTVINSIALSIKNYAITILLIAVWLFTPLLCNLLQSYTIPILSFELFFNLALRVYICSVFLHRAFGLKKIKYVRNGEAYEESYDDLIEYLDEDGNVITRERDDSEEEDSDEDETEDEAAGDEKEGSDEETSSEEESSGSEDESAEP